MSMKEWAENEVRLACEADTGAENDSTCNYITGCYKSALRAYESVIEGNFTGDGYGVMAEALERLLEGKPLTPIEDEPDSWNYISTDEKGMVTLQCRRMASLFKEIYPDGKIIFSDLNRSYCVDINNVSRPFRFNIASDILDQICPIEMPYYPPIQTAAVFYCYCFKASTNHICDFDTFGILYALIPGHEDPASNPLSIFEINRYFKDCNDESGMTEISKDEFVNRFDTYNTRMKMEEKANE